MANPPRLGVLFVRLRGAGTIPCPRRGHPIVTRAPSRRPGAALAAVAVTLLAGCRSTPAPAPRDPRPAPGTHGIVATSPLAAGVVDSARSVLGAPYRQAGADPRGFDCSGLTTWLFASAGLDLPRTAAAQAETGRWVALDELAAGDLVFFARAGKPDHVGLVVSAPGEPLRMIHASSSRGVIETEVLRDGYWLDRLRFGRRVLP